MGRIAHKMGVRYGHDGLSVVFRDGNHQFAERILSKDTDRILTFLDYDAARWRQGFDTLEEIFEFAASTPYFNSAIFAYENRNHTSRVRDRKRAVYRGFLEWQESRSDLPAYPWADTSEIGGRRLDEDALLRIFAAFPEFEPEYASVMAEHELHCQAKQIFNGEIVSELTGLTGHELGHFMRELKTYISGSGDFNHWVADAGRGGEGLSSWCRSILTPGRRAIRLHEALEIPENLGRTTGLEPATSAVTMLCSTN